MTGKQKATAIGAGTGAVAGAVVGGPVGAVVGAGIGGYMGHEGTDANGKVATTGTTGASDSTVRDAQAALNSQGYSAGMVDGRWGPSTQNAVRRFQSDRGLEQSGTLDSATLSALGVTADPDHRASRLFPGSPAGRSAGDLFACCWLLRVARDEYHIAIAVRNTGGQRHVQVPTTP